MEQGCTPTPPPPPRVIPSPEAAGGGGSGETPPGKVVVSRKDLFAMCRDTGTVNQVPADSAEPLVLQVKKYRDGGVESEFRGGEEQRTDLERSVTIQSYLLGGLPLGSAMALCILPSAPAAAG